MSIVRDITLFITILGSAALLAQSSSAVPPQTQPARLVGRLEGCGGAAVSFSRDGTLILTAADDNVLTTARVWDARTFTPLRDPVRLKGGWRCAGFAGHGKNAFLVTQFGGLLWDVATGKPVGDLPKPGQKTGHH